MFRSYTQENSWQHFLKKTQDRFDKISDERVEISNCMTNCFYSKQNDNESYLEEKHKKYKINIEEDSIENQI